MEISMIENLLIVVAVIIFALPWLIEIVVPTSERPTTSTVKYNKEANPLNGR